MRRRRACLALAAALTLVVASPSVGQEPARDGLPAYGLAANGLTVYGQADYDWTIRPLDGEPVELETFRGRVLFLNLWASWCTPCVRELASIERLRDRLADTDVAFLIVAAEGERPVRSFLRKYGYDLPVYLEVDPVPSAFGMRGLPTTWVVDREGRIVLLRHGEAVWDSDDVEGFVRAVGR